MKWASVVIHEHLGFADRIDGFGSYLGTMY